MYNRMQKLDFEGGHLDSVIKKWIGMGLGFLLEFTAALVFYVLTFGLLWEIQLFFLSSP